MASSNSRLLSSKSQARTATSSLRSPGKKRKKVVFTNCEMSLYQNVFSLRCLYIKRSSYQNVFLSKCLFIKMSFCRNVFFQNVFLSKYHEQNNISVTDNSNLYHSNQITNVYRGVFRTTSDFQKAKKTCYLLWTALNCSMQNQKKWIKCLILTDMRKAAKSADSFTLQSHKWQLTFNTLQLRWRQLNEPS